MSTLSEKAPVPRLLSLDALRGFDMIWISGADAVVIALAQLLHWGWLDAVAEQLDHVAWNGFHAFDLIFPLFLFLAGVGIPQWLERRQTQGLGRGALYGAMLRRLGWLIFLGLVYNGLTREGLSHLRFASVLARIGFGWFFATALVLHFRIRGQILWALGILVGYFLWLKYLPMPFGSYGDFTPDGSWVACLDRLFLPGTLYNTTNDPEGLLSTIPAVVTGLLGSWAGQILRRPESTCSGNRKAATLALAGVAGLGLGLLWDPWFPINKALWSSSFVLFAGGWSFLLLSGFYWVIDVVGFSAWAWPFSVIGRNSITIYVGATLIPFGMIAGNLLGWLTPHLSESWQHVVAPAGQLAVMWCFLWFLDWKKVYLRV